MRSHGHSHRDRDTVIFNNSNITCSSMTDDHKFLVSPEDMGIKTIMDSKDINININIIREAMDRGDLMIMGLMVTMDQGQNDIILIEVDSIILINNSNTSSLTNEDMM